MIIVNLSGGLGNQMFQYAFGLGLADEFNREVKFSVDMFDMYKSHNGLELQRVFDLDIDVARPVDVSKIIGWIRSFPSVRRLLGKLEKTWICGKSFILEPGGDVYAGIREDCYLQGYWQSENFFPKDVQQVRDAFTFRSELAGKNKIIADAIANSKNSVSVHVRRGDYISNPKVTAVHGVCSESYYFSAMDMFEEKLGGVDFYLFSDDPDWVKKNIAPRYSGCVIVDHNHGLESYNDMRLMAMCKHNIIANSTFSWWSAWLNKNNEKVVVAPKVWFAGKSTSLDILPNDWMRI